MTTRREFLKLGGAAGATLFFTVKFGKFSRVFALPIPGGTLDPTAVPKYASPMIIPPAMPRTKRLRVIGAKNIDYYEIAVRQFEQQILPAGLPATTVWSYGSLKKPGTVAEGGTFNYPAFTIEADFRRPVRVKWINDLVDANGNYLPHLLPVDPTLHWANVPMTPNRMGIAATDVRPDYTGKTYVPLAEFTDPNTQYTQYTGPVPLCTHVHGAPGVGDESDGYAEAWFLPAANNIPDGYATKGTWYNTFKNEFYNERMIGDPTDSWEAGSATFQYPNDDRAATLWYHDHTLGMTRVNVYAGPAGFFLLRGGRDDRVRDTRGGRAVLPGPAPNQNSGPFDAGIYEIPIAIQDRSFDADGQLFYPDTREFFDGLVGDLLPNGEYSPIWNPEFFGNVMVVNGVSWPFQTVEQRRYRLRFLNGCDARFLILDFNAIPGVEVWQIGAEGGFLAAPVNMTAVNGNRVLMAPAERADLIVDFTNVPEGSYILNNLGPDEPFGGGEPDIDFDRSDPGTTGQIMEFRVVPIVGTDDSTPPQFMRLPIISPLVGGATRQLALIEKMGMGIDAQGTPLEGPVEALLGRVVGGMPVEDLWMDPITENPQVGDTETWEIYNFTGDAHPIHVHEVTFQVVDRQGLVLDAAGEVALPVALSGAPRMPDAWEDGFKDTVIAYPGEVTRIRMRFDTPGLYVWHCHIVEHEDNEMMRPYAVGLIPTLLPTANGSINVGHLHNQAILNYTNVGGLTLKESIKPASGLDAIVGQGVIIDALNGVTEVGGGEGYGVRAPGQNNADRKQIDGVEELSFQINPALLKTQVVEMSAKFRMAVGGSAEVIATAYLRGELVGTWQQVVTAVSPTSRFSDVQTMRFDQVFDKIVFTAGAGSAYSVVNPITFNTYSA